jgi:hypothetical protein
VSAGTVEIKVKLPSQIPSREAEKLDKEYEVGAIRARTSHGPLMAPLT